MTKEGLRAAWLKLFLGILLLFPGGVFFLWALWQGDGNRLAWFALGGVVATVFKYFNCWYDEMSDTFFGAIALAASIALWFLHGWSARIIVLPAAFQLFWLTMELLQNAEWIDAHYKWQKERLLDP